jgi:hypothetical protein
MSAPAIELTSVPDAAPPYDGEPDAAAGAAVFSAAPDPVPVPLASAAPPDDWPHRFADILTEIIAGSRPHQQLVPFSTERARLHLRRIIPAFAGGGRPRVLRVLTTHPAPDVAETTVILACGQRARALALRLERAASGRWLCTAIEAG